MNLRKIRRNLKNHGVARVLFDLFYGAINKVCYFRILKGLKLEMSDLDMSYLTAESFYDQGFMMVDEMLKFSDQETYDLPRDFINYAARKSDECFALVDHGNLAAYGWYAKSDTRLSSELDLHFNSRWVYMYRGFTHPEYRGQRLHGIGMAGALKGFVDRGYCGLISYVEANNFNSLRSVYRMGYRDIGSIYILKLFGRYFIRHDQGCAAYDFRVIRHRKETPALAGVVAKP